MNEVFIRHLERASEIVSTWPEWKQNLLGRRTMNQVDQAARRAATKVWTLHMNGLPDVEATIAAEFAPLQERLTAAERLLGRALKCVESEAAMFDAMERHQVMPHGSEAEANVTKAANTYYELKCEIVKFLAAKPTEGEHNDVATD